MCGIGGVWVMGNDKLTKKDAQRLEELAIYLETRGTDAFGFYNGEKVIKFPSCASDVIEMIDRIKPFEELVIGKNMFLMHTRAYTNGDPLRNKNNHPFELKDIVFAHNGVVHVQTTYVDYRWKGKHQSKGVEYIDSYEIFGRIEIDLPETDSFEIGVQIQREYNKRKDFKKAVVKALERLIYYGDMAVWVYSKKEDLLALFKHERPLYISYEDGKLWFASEGWMLKNIGLSNTVFVGEGELLIYDRNGKVYGDFLVDEYYYAYDNTEMSEKDVDDLEKEYWKLWRDYGFWYY